MTVCIAAIAAKSKAIVMVADKAITYGEQSFQADMGIKKIVPVGKTGWYALIGGNPSFAQEVIDATVADIVTVDPKKTHHSAYPGVLKDMMLCMKDAYKAVRRQWVADRYLAPRMLDEKNPFAGLPDEYKVDLMALMADFKITCSLLVCGFDGQMIPHIFSVVSPGIASCHDIPGFHAVGIGRDAAIGELYQFETEADDPLDAALYEVFYAKATAEIVQGVGYGWDCSILTSDHDPIEINKMAREAVENLLSESTTSPYRSDWGKKFNKFDGWKKTIREFTDNALKPPSKVLPKKTMKANSKKSLSRKPEAKIP